MTDLLHDLNAESLADDELKAIAGQYRRFRVTNIAGPLYAFVLWQNSLPRTPASGFWLERLRVTNQNAAIDIQLTINIGRRNSVHDIRAQIGGGAFNPADRRDIRADQAAGACVTGWTIGPNIGPVGFLQIWQDYIFRSSVFDRPIRTFCDVDDQWYFGLNNFGGVTVPWELTGIEFLTPQASDWFLSRML